MAHRLRERPRHIIAGIRAVAVAQGYRLHHWRFGGPRVRLRMVSGRRVTVPAFEIAVVELSFTVTGAMTVVEVRLRQRRRWWTMSVRGALRVFSVLGDWPLPTPVCTALLANAMDDADTREYEDHLRLLDMVGDYLRSREIGELSEDPFRRALPR